MRIAENRGRFEVVLEMLSLLWRMMCKLRIRKKMSNWKLRDSRLRFSSLYFLQWVFTGGVVVFKSLYLKLLSRYTERRLTVSIT